MAMLEFTSSLSISILKIAVFSEPKHALEMLSLFHRLMIVAAVLTAKIFRMVETGEKITNKISKSVSFFRKPQNIVETYAHT